MHENEFAPDSADAYRESVPSIYRIVRTLSGYRAAIALALLAVTVGYILIAAILLMRAPSQRVVTLPFRLDFAGASTGAYPNGLKFSSGDIVAAPIVSAAYERNRLDRFLSAAAFAGSLVVVEQNAALERLTADYRARLSDARLSPVDRERLMTEFQQKSASLDKDQWAISLVIPDKTGTIPPTVATKTLHDVLHLWADDTAVTKRALQFRVPTLTANVFREESADEELVISLMRLRSRILSVIENIHEVSRLPGGELVRTKQNNMSLAELELLLSDLLRVEVEPLIARSIETGTIRNPAATLNVLETQRDYDRRQLASVQRRAEVLRAAMSDYLSEQYSTLPQLAARGENGAPPVPRSTQGSEAVVPQLSESFLDRLVRMANNSSDLEYRQRMVDEIRNASLATVPLESTVAFDEQVIAQAASAASGGANPAMQAALRAQYDAARRRAIAAVNDVNEIYGLLSRNLQPSAQLFTLVGPSTSRIERTLSPMRLALGGLITLLVAIPVLIAAAFIHSRFVRERDEDERATPVQS